MTILKIKTSYELRVINKNGQLSRKENKMIEIITFNKDPVSMKHPVKDYIAFVVYTDRCALELFIIGAGKITHCGTKHFYTFDADECTTIEEFVKRYYSTALWVRLYKSTEEFSILFKEKPDIEHAELTPIDWA